MNSSEYIPFLEVLKAEQAEKFAELLQAAAERFSQLDQTTHALLTAATGLGLDFIRPARIPLPKEATPEQRAAKKRSC